MEQEYCYEDLKKCSLCDNWIECKYVRLVNRYYHKCCLERAFRVFYNV